MLGGLGRDAEALGALEDDLRRRLYLFVRAQGRPVTREEAAGAIGVSRKLAAFHLDKLVDRGLLVGTYARPPGRGGRGAGRSSKHYEPSDREFSVTIPERRYDLFGSVVLKAVRSLRDGAGAFELMASNADIEAVKLPAVIKTIREVARAIGSQGMIGGQVMDLAGEDHCAEFDLKTLHSLKTGELFIASLRAGGILGGISESGLNALTRFGHCFGLAFQITDDILDISGDQNQMGKPVGSDQKNIRTTYTSLYGLDGAQEQAEQSVNECLAALAGFGNEADFLRDLAQFTLHRTS
jgi:hypothetical protein